MVLFFIFLILKSLILTCVPKHAPPSHLPPHNISVGHPHAPAPSMLYPGSDIDWRFNSYMMVYMLECHSPKSSHPLPLPLSPNRMDWLDLLAVQGTLKSLLQHHSSKASILQCSAFFTVQLSHPYMTTGKTISVRFQGKLFYITVIQAYAPTSNAEEAEVVWFYEDLQDLLELTP